MIYRITYLSGGLRVMGYLAFPSGAETTAEGIQEWLRLQCRDEELTAEAVACVMPSAEFSAAAARRDAGFTTSETESGASAAVEQPKTEDADAQAAASQQPKVQDADAQVPASQRPKVQGVDAQVPASQRPKVQGADAQVPASQWLKVQDVDAQVPASQRPKVQGVDAQVPASQRPKVQDVSTARELGRASASQAPGSYPVLVYCRGGIGRVGRVRLDWLAEFAAFGHIVMAPCYRGGESGVGHDEFGGADLEDSRIAVRLARAIPGADPARIAVLGFSRGSINATDAAIEEQASRLVLWGGLSDLAVTYEERIDLRRMLKRVIKGSAYKLPDVYLERSPIHMAKRLNCPVLIMHGTEDAQVDYGHGERMYAELRRLGKSATLTRLEGLGHHMPQEIRMRVLASMFAWLEAPPPKP